MGENSCLGGKTAWQDWADGHGVRLGGGGDSVGSLLPRQEATHTRILTGLNVQWKASKAKTGQCRKCALTQVKCWGGREYWGTAIHGLVKKEKLRKGHDLLESR